MGINLRLSSSSSGTRNTGDSGFGGGPNLRAANLFTADDMHIDGLYWVRPFDMENDFGPEGAAIAAAKGHRYAFCISSDHWDSSYGWARGGGIWMAWGDDPGNYPTADQFRMVVPCSITVDSIVHTQNETPWLVYNPDDLPDHPFHMYVHGVKDTHQHTMLFRSADMDNWTIVTRTHEYPAWALGHTGYQQITRNGTGDWESIGLGNVSAFTQNTTAHWTSTDGITFSVDSANIDTRVDKSDFAVSDGVLVTIGSTLYRITREDNFDTTLNVNPNSTPGAVRVGQYVSAVPVSSTGAVATNNLNDVIRISDRYAGNYPGPDYLQSVSGYAEDGVAHIWATHGFFSDTGLGVGNQGADYADGGGYDNELVDYYTYIYDATAAAQAAPCGVRWSCSAGVVTLQWYDALPNNTYRVYRGTTIGTQATLIGDVTGTSTTDSPATGTYYYKVVTLEGGTERGHRIIRARVSSNSALVNKHYDRVVAAGGDGATIDTSWLTAVEGWLSSQGLTNNLLYWADPAFGVIKDGSNILSKVFCLGTTLKPRGGDYTPITSSTTYSATGLNGTVPAWVNGTNTASGYFGGQRLNNIRRKTALTLVGVYQKSGTSLCTLFAWGENNTGYYLQNSSGTGNATLFAGMTASWSATATGPATLTNGVAHIIGGTLTGSQAIAYVEGVAGTPAACTNTLPMKGTLGSGQVFFLGSGSYGLKNQVAMTATDASGSYVFSSNQAAFTASDLIVFDAELSGAQMASLNALIRARIGP